MEPPSRLRREVPATTVSMPRSSPGADPEARLRAPIRRALDAILLRWLGLYVLAGVVIVCPVLCGVGVAHMPIWRAALPAFLVGFIGIHLWHRRRAARSDGWRLAASVDRGSIALLALVGLAALVLVAIGFVAIFWPYENPFEVVLVTSMGGPLLVPLWVVATWVALDCATRRLARSADEADRALREYWEHVSRP